MPPREGEGRDSPHTHTHTLLLEVRRKSTRSQHIIIQYKQVWQWPGKERENVQAAQKYNRNTRHTSETLIEHATQWFGP